MRQHSRTSKGGTGGGRRLRRLGFLMALAALVTAALATYTAASSTRELDTERRQQPVPQRLRQPPLAWLEGTLRQSRTGNWALADGTPLQTRNVRWREEEGGHETVPTAGREVRLMGQWYGNTFRVRQATLLSAQWAIDRAKTMPVTRADEPIPEQPQ